VVSPSEVYGVIDMNERINNLTRGLTKKQGTTRAEIEKVMSFLGVTFPEDYIEFMIESNGAEGFLQNGRYLMIDPIEHIIPGNQPYGLGSSGPGLIIFGSDGGCILYAFDIRQTPPMIVEVDATCMELGPLIQCGRNFEEFIEYINK
jgi:hypothetical protein